MFFEFSLIIRARKFQFSYRTISEHWYLFLDYFVSFYFFGIAVSLDFETEPVEGFSLQLSLGRSPSTHPEALPSLARIDYNRLFTFLFWLARGNEASKFVAGRVALSDEDSSKWNYFRLGRFHQTPISVSLFFSYRLEIWQIIDSINQDRAPISKLRFLE